MGARVVGGSVDEDRRRVCDRLAAANRTRRHHPVARMVALRGAADDLHDGPNTLARSRWISARRSSLRRSSLRGRLGPCGRLTVPGVSASGGGDVRVRRRPAAAAPFQGFHRISRSRSAGARVPTRSYSAPTCRRRPERSRLRRRCRLRRRRRRRLRLRRWLLALRRRRDGGGGGGGRWRLARGALARGADLEAEEAGDLGTRAEAARVGRRREEVSVHLAVARRPRGGALVDDAVPPRRGPCAPSAGDAAAAPPLSATNVRRREIFAAEASRPPRSAPRGRRRRRRRRAPRPPPPSGRPCRHHCRLRRAPPAPSASSSMTSAGAVVQPAQNQSPSGTTTGRSRQRM